MYLIFIMQERQYKFSTKNNPLKRNNITTAFIKYIIRRQSLRMS